MRERLIFITGNEKIAFDSNKFVLTKAEGINSPDVKRQEVSFIDSDGKKIIRTAYASKTVSIYGYIRASDKNELYALKLKLTHVLDCKNDGKLIYEVDNKRYFTEVVPKEPPVFGDIVQNFLPFTVHFDAYNINWKSFKKTEDDVYERIPGIPEEDGTFTFPCVFSYRVNKKTFYNKGNLECDFICTIQGTSITAENAVATMSIDETVAEGFKITNNTTGEQMIINHDIALGEIVTIDTADFSIVSSEHGNILHKLQNGTDFFKLAPGKSEIEITNFNVENNILVNLSFYETYREV